MKKSNDFSINNGYKNIITYIILYFLCLSPLFLITIRGWSSSILIIGSFSCLIYLFIYHITGDKKLNLLNRDTKLLIIAFFSPVFAVAISSIVRNSFYFSQFDSPVRFIVAISILFFIIHAKIDVAKILQFIIPLSLLITLSQQHLVPQPMLWGAERMATYFADPLVFGYTSLTFGLLCLVSINHLKIESILLLSIKIIGTLIGIYLSIQSGSRTGWLATPIILGIWFYQISSKKTFLYFLKMTAIAFLVPIILYFSVSTINYRINLTIDEIINYSWTGIAPETSIGFRITFLRMAWDIFLQNPWVGVGETSFQLFSIPQKIYSYASTKAIETALKSGFHNEIITNGIRFGLFGLISSISLFFIPFYIFFSKIKSNNRINRKNSLIGISFVTSIFISSLSTEVFDLKYTSSFYALMISMLSGSVITRHE